MAKSLRNLAGMPSGPFALPGFRLFRSLSIPFEQIVIGFILDSWGLLLQMVGGGVP